MVGFTDSLQIYQPSVLLFILQSATTALLKVNTVTRMPMFAVSGFVYTRRQLAGRIPCKGGFRT